MNPMEWYGVEAMQQFFLDEMKKTTDAMGAEISSALRGVEQQLSDLTASVDELQLAVQGVSERVDALVNSTQVKLDEAVAALETERQAAADLAAAEDAEDVAQNAALAEAKAATDAALADAATAAGEIRDAVSNLNAVAPSADPTEPQPEPEPSPEPEPTEPPVEPAPEEPVQ